MPWTTKQKIFCLLLVVLGIGFGFGCCYSRDNDLGFHPGWIQSPTNAETAFTSIYNNNSWGLPLKDDGPAFSSGSGAHPEKCSEYIEYVQTVLNRPDIQHVVEIGCGDLRVTNKLNLDATTSYSCVDVAPQVIQNGKEQKNTKIEMVQGDASTMDFESADLLIAKDVFQHWPTESVLQFEKEQLPKFTEAIITNDYLPTKSNSRKDIPFGGYSYITLRGNRDVIMDSVCQSRSKQTQHFRN